MLDLDFSQTIESGLVSRSNHCHGVPEAQWHLGTDLSLEIGGTECGAGGLLGRRSESGRGSDEGGEDAGGGLHGVAKIWVFRWIDFIL